MNIMLKPYPEYNDSGLPWLGKVPGHWEVRKLRNVLILRRHADRNRPELPLLSVVREKGVILRDVANRDENRNFIPDDLSNYKVVREGQFVMNKMKAWQGSYGVSRHDGIVSPAYFIFDMREVEGDYFHTAIRSKAYVPFFTQASDGVRIGQWDLSQARMQEIPFFIPPLPEQSAIVNFISHFDRGINRFIRNRQLLIDLLNEQKQAIIHRAVTRGLDPNVRLKSSGVPWLGDVPEHWEVKRLRHVGKAIIGLTYEPNDVVDEKNGVLVLRASNVGNGRIVLKDNVFVKRKIPEHLRTRKGDILICSRSGSRALIGKNAKIDGLAVGVTFGTFMTVFRSQYNDYLLHVFNSKLFDYQSGAFLTSTINQLTIGNFYSFTVPFPPPKEQTAIAQFLDGESTNFERASSTVQREIDLLREYRTRLIADVVTGKLDVRGVEMPAFDEAGEMEYLDTSEDAEAKETDDTEEAVNDDEQ